jgi:hypothetical protein
MAAEPDPRVVDNPEQGRYELWLGATRAGFVDYLSEPGTLLLVHTEVDPAFEGRGSGGGWSPMAGNVMWNITVMANCHLERSSRLNAAS